MSRISDHASPMSYNSSALSKPKKNLNTISLDLQSIDFIKESNKFDLHFFFLNMKYNITGVILYKLNGGIGVSVKNQNGESATVSMSVPFDVIGIATAEYKKKELGIIIL